MRILDAFPMKSQYKPDEKIRIKVLIENDTDTEDKYLLCKVYSLAYEINSYRYNINKIEKEIVFDFSLDISKHEILGYGVELELYAENKLADSLTTAFDVAKSWEYAPRYGFISDFSKEDTGDKNDVEEMNKLHLNVIQFYDWMYRHHELIPPQEDFVDPLGRKLSLKTVTEKIGLCHEYSMQAMAYGAVYGAGEEFYKAYKEMGLYNNDDSALGFAGFLNIMDINKESPWHNHIINEFYKAIQLGFDGIHMDQYGFPKEALSKINNKDSVRHLRDDFPALINDTRTYMNEKECEVNLIFNAVNNWPIDSVSKASEDAMYIEVWPPNVTYQDLYNLIAGAKKLESEKQVILAAYMKPFLKSSEASGKLSVTDERQAENAALMAMASIFSSGGFHLLLGENRGILTEGYYPRYYTASLDFQRKLRDYYDFIVRYEELLFDLSIVDNSMTYTGGINEEYVFRGGSFSPKAQSNSIWTLVKEKPGFKLINLVNFTGIEDMNWNEPKMSLPASVKDIEVTALIAEKVKSVFLCSPDINSGHTEKLDFEYIPDEKGRLIKIRVPELKLWDLIYVETE